MRAYYAIIALVFVCVIAGVSSQTLTVDPGTKPAIIQSPQGQYSLAEIVPFSTAIVWSTTTGNQVVDVVVDNFDSDPNDEVATISQNGTLSLFDDDATLLWRLNLRATPYDLASFDGTVAAGQELLVGTSTGILVVGANKFIQMNLTLPEPVRVVAGANLDGDALEELVGGCDDFYTYAYEIDATLLWSHLSNGRVRLLTAVDIDSDAREEVLIASDAKRFTLLQDTGAVIFENTAADAINAVRLGDLTTAGSLDVAIGFANGTVSVIYATGTVAFTIVAPSSITALQVGDLVAGGRHELALGTSSNVLTVYDSSGGLLWNKTLTGTINRILFPNVGATS
ncbi:MAG: hypothetical protein OEV85_14520, partial [Candidatus Thorarchaeota archaeon]|nr:hypothetical protein [Candidatus Thorarchaeota archaeon]